MTCDNKLHIQDTPVHSSECAGGQKLSSYNIGPMIIVDGVEEGERGGDLLRN